MPCFWTDEVNTTCTSVGFSLVEISTKSTGKFCYITPDGLTLFAGQYPYVVPLTDYNVFYKSLDNGISWVQIQEDISFNSTGFGDFISFTSNYDGTVLIGGANGNELKVSSDSGNSWIIGISSNYYEAASSYSGEKVFLTCSLSGANKFRRSVDYGTTFTNSQSSADFLCCSSDASFVYLQTLSGFSRSTDFGATFTLIGQVIGKRGVCCSADGSILYASVDFGSNLKSIFKSIDYGNTFTKIATLPIAIGVIKCSADGTKLLCKAYDSGITPVAYLYYSIDSGITWNTLGTQEQWKMISMSATGKYIAANSSSINKFLIGSL